MIPERISMFSNSGQLRRNSWYSARRAESHDVLDAGAVVPTAVEQHHFARRREMGDVTLEIPARLVAFAGASQGDDAADARD